MTIDERLGFLLQSTESLHASMAEVHASISELHVIVREHSKQLEQDSENVRSLARIAAIHEHRLSDLEDGEENY